MKIKIRMAMINFDCNKCKEEFDCEVGKITFPENINEKLGFEKDIICPNCGKLDKEEILLTECGQIQIGELYFKEPVIKGYDAYDGLNINIDNEKVKDKSLRKEIYNMDEGFVPFFRICPEIAEKETRGWINFENKSFPDGQYFLMENYCNNKSCDCRKVMINIIRKDKILATIGYGWENVEFYKKWVKDDSLGIEMKGPSLELGGIQSKYSKALMKFFEGYMINDGVFVNRLKKHYETFKKRLIESKEIDFEGLSENYESTDSKEETWERDKVGRNEPCPCGSGKKYKKCCLKL